MYCHTIVTISGIQEVYPQQFEDFDLTDSDEPIYEPPIQTSSRKRNHEKVRQKYPNAFRKWTADDDQALRRFFDDGSTLDELASSFQRTIPALVIRLHKLGCLDNLALNSI